VFEKGRKECPTSAQRGNAKEDTSEGRALPNSRFRVKVLVLFEGAFDVKPAMACLRYTERRRV
jgi:hypothetical protein